MHQGRNRNIGRADTQSSADDRAFSPFSPHEDDKPAAFGFYTSTHSASNSTTYDHRVRNIGHPVRSAIHKPCIGGLVVGSVTTSEYPLLYVLALFGLSDEAAQRCLSSLYGRFTRIFVVWSSDEFFGMLWKEGLRLAISFERHHTSGLHASFTNYP